MPLQAPTGFGVTNIALLSGGANYIGAPAVMITGGSGTGATAIAQINAAGVITNILVTSVGYGYLPTDSADRAAAGRRRDQHRFLGTVTSRRTPTPAAWSRRARGR
jgi:adenylate kinase